MIINKEIIKFLEEITEYGTIEQYKIIDDNTVSIVPIKPIDYIDCTIIIKDSKDET